MPRRQDQVRRPRQKYDSAEDEQSDYVSTEQIAQLRD
jgi:hypothetical protein